MTTTYKTLWKTLANAKAIEAFHVVQYCAVKTVKAKGENKSEIFNALLRKAFSPNIYGQRPMLANNVWQARITGWDGKTLFNQVPIKEFLTDEELLMYQGLLNAFSPKNLVDPNYYSYIFVRQDLSPEQQLVQAAHVTCVLGSKIKTDPSKLYFVVVGVEDLDRLNEICVSLSLKGHEFVDFIEPDVGDERTAIATLPIRGDMRKDFKKFNLLKF
jgi:hypothetical protein